MKSRVWYETASRAVPPYPRINNVGLIYHLAIGYETLNAICAARQFARIRNSSGIRWSPGVLSQ